MKRCALFLAIACFSMAGAAQKTFIGVIHDNRCIGPNCARQCPVTKDPRYTLQSGEDAWILTDRKNPGRFSGTRYTGKKVVVIGTRGPGNTLLVSSVVLAK
jgi:hypothetical protein